MEMRLHGESSANFLAVGRTESPPLGNWSGDLTLDYGKPSLSGVYKDSFFPSSWSLLTNDELMLTQQTYLSLNYVKNSIIGV